MASAFIEKRTSDLTGKVSYRAMVQFKNEATGKMTSRSATFPLKREAKKWLAQLGYEAKQAGGYRKPVASDLATYITAWHLSRTYLWRASTAAIYLYLIEQYVTAKGIGVGGVEMEKLSTSVLTAWVARLYERGLSCSTVRSTLAVVKRCLADAVIDGDIPRNPALDVKLKPLNVIESTVMNDDAGSVLASRS